MPAACSPSKAVFSPEVLAEIARNCIGPTFGSYRFAGKHRALPLDARRKSNRPDFAELLRSRYMGRSVTLSRSSGGLETAMSCDIRVASESAQFAAPEIKLGWIGGGGMAAHLRIRWALRMLLS